LILDVLHTTRKELPQISIKICNTLHRASNTVYDADTTLQATSTQRFLTAYFGLQRSTDVFLHQLTTRQNFKRGLSSKIEPISVNNILGNKN
jgi:hypothetical protein